MIVNVKGLVTDDAIKLAVIFDPQNCGIHEGGG
jgi:hypothetical protein